MSLSLRRVSLLVISTIVGLASGCSALLSDTEPFGRVRLRVVTPDGEPIAGVAAVLYTGLRPMSYDTTDSRGEVVYRYVPPDGYGISIDIPQGLMHTTPGETFTYRDDLTVTAGEETIAEFVLRSPGFGALEAEVLDSALQPVEGITLTVYTFRDVVTTMQTDSTGLARVDSLPIDNYGVRMTVPDSLGGSSGPLLFNDQLTMTALVTPRPRFVIAVCRGELEVDVRDQFSQPISGMTVTRYNSQETLGARVTAANGQTRFRGALCGAQGLRLEPRSGFTISATRGNGYVDMLLTRGDTVRVTLRATRN